ncbi:hypothetical protein AV530_011888 [Patagioenas fasciata monilis]|uniref:Uncharacterized protein n=1 Tax=Patagioenas fasciata monilis TaxID=372326 RepID=A0A1V4JVJ1_PATFA|nr:hypothetical protein AV530_011888 [Patagioenas fasciata monilis]
MDHCLWELVTYLSVPSYTAFQTIRKVMQQGPHQAGFHAEEKWTSKITLITQPKSSLNAFHRVPMNLFLQMGKATLGKLTIIKGFGTSFDLTECRGSRGKAACFTVIDSYPDGFLMEIVYGLQTVPPINIDLHTDSSGIPSTGRLWSEQGV